MTSSHVVDVPVTTVWASPEAPREVDRALAADAPDPAGWCGSHGAQDRLGLHGRMLTQALLGEPADALDEQGRWTRVRAPADACGKVRAEVREAVQGLRLTPARPGGGIESSEAAAAGCTQQWANLVAVAAGRVTAGGPAVVPPGFDGPVQVRLCVYRVSAEQQHSAKPAGEFVAGRYLDDEQWAGVRREIEAAGPAADCTTPASGFAVLHFGAGQLTAELDGCRRLLATAADGSETVRRASPALITLLAGR